MIITQRRSGTLKHILTCQLTSRARKTLETMMRLTLPEILHQLTIKSLFEKDQIEISTCLRVSYSKSLYVNPVFFQVHHFAAQCLRIFQSKQHHNEQVPVTLPCIKKLIPQSCIFRLRYFTAQYLRKLHRKERKNEQVPAKKTVFDRLHKASRLFKDVKKCKF